LDILIGISVLAPNVASHRQKLWNHDVRITAEALVVRQPGRVWISLLLRAQ